MKSSTYILILSAIGLGFQSLGKGMPAPVSAAILVLVGLFFVCKAIEDLKP